MNQIIDTIAEQGLTVSETEQLIADLLKKPQGKAKKGKTVMAGYFKYGIANLTTNKGFKDGANGVAEPVQGGLSEGELSYLVRAELNQRFLNSTVNDKTHCVVANFMKGVPYNVTAIRVGTYPSQCKRPELDSEQYRIYATEGKSVTLKGNGGGMGAKTGLYAMRCPCYARPIEFDKCGKPIKAVSAADGKTYTVYEVKDGQITIKDKQYPIKLADGFYIIRKLTVRECMRLQTVPEWYEFPVSDTQAYRQIGNGWTVSVICHLLNATLAEPSRYRVEEDQLYFTDVN